MTMTTLVGWYVVLWVRWSSRRWDGVPKSIGSVVVVVVVPVVRMPPIVSIAMGVAVVEMCCCCC